MVLGHGWRRRYPTQDDVAKNADLKSWAKAYFHEDLAPNGQEERPVVIGSDAET